MTSSDGSGQLLQRAGEPVQSFPGPFPTLPPFTFQKEKKKPTKISLLFLSPIPSSSPISLTTRFVYMLIASQFAALVNIFLLSSFIHSFFHSPPPTALSLPLSQQTPPSTPSPSLCLSLSHTLYFPPSRSLSRSLPLSVCQCHSVVEMWRLFLPLCLFFQPKSAEEGKMETFFSPLTLNSTFAVIPAGARPSCACFGIRVRMWPSGNDFSSDF